MPIARRIAALLLVLAVGLASCTSTDEPGGSAPPSGAPQGSYDVGGHRLYLDCRGHRADGTPLVVIESGVGPSSWDSVQGPLADAAEVCTYDRANVGASDTVTGQRTAKAAADDLHALLAAAKLKPPYVIVAHSFGPMIATVFNDDHPGEVVGLVLVDPRGPDVTRDQHAALPPKRPQESSAIATARRAFVHAVFDANDENMRFGPSEQQARQVLDQPGPAFGDMPVIVLHATGTQASLPRLPRNLGDLWWQIWSEGQQRYADESTNGEVRVVAGSGHSIQDDKPHAVIAAVKDVLGRVLG
jgi:pimeloyl-ACP methyl ester carboxylesterase